MARHHLACGSGVLALRLTVEIARRNGHHMLLRWERNQNYEQSVARGRRRQRGWVKQRFFDA